MDQMQVVDVEDGKDKDFNVAVKNALKLCSPGGEEVHLLCAKKPEQKQRWLRAFADEREQVQHDLETGEQHFFFRSGSWKSHEKCLQSLNGLL